MRSAGVRAALLLVAFLLAPQLSLAAGQALEFPSAPAWYLVSFQIEPDDPDPEAVFPIAGGFAYDHIWSYDPVAGWSHFAPNPDPTVAAVVNDLNTIEALRGYWIHVTSVDPGGSVLPTSSGSVRKLLRLNGAAWHAIGAPLAPDADPANVEAVFAELGPALSSRVKEVWRYAEGTGFVRIPATSYAADCVSSPGQCLAPGKGYWLKTTGSVQVGQQLVLSTDCVLLSSTAPYGRLEVTFDGVGAAAGSIRGAVTNPAGLQFRPARRDMIDGVVVPGPDESQVGGDGPDATADLDGNGTPEACPDTCGSDEDCVDLCFGAATGDPHVVFVSIDPVAFAQIPSYTSCSDDPASADLEVSLGPDVVGHVKVAVRPPSLLGHYAGTLLYGDEAVAPAPIHMRLDDCSLSPNQAYSEDPDDCELSSGSVTALINATVLGSSANLVDDDLDGDIDEADEEGRSIPVRDTPGFGLDTALYGSISGDRRFLRLEAKLGVAPDLAFALGAPPDGGIASAFAGATREFTLEVERTSAAGFVGTFVDRYRGTSLAAKDLVSTGQVVLERVQAPRCVIRNRASNRSAALDILCRGDADCPGYCAGDPQVEGLSCDVDADCQLTLPDGTPVGGAATCQRYRCRFPGIPGENAGLFARADTSVQVVDPNQPVIQDDVLVELSGPQLAFGLATTAASGVVDFGRLRCGSYTARVVSPGCAASTVVFDPCVDPPPVLGDLVCTGPPGTGDCMPLPGDTCAPTLADLGTPEQITAVFASTGVDHLVLDLSDPNLPEVSYTDPVVLYDPLGSSVRVTASAGQPAVAGAKFGGGWTDLFEWTSLVARVRAGLLALLGSSG